MLLNAGLLGEDEKTYHLTGTNFNLDLLIALRLRVMLPATAPSNFQQTQIQPYCAIRTPRFPNRE